LTLSAKSDSTMRATAGRHAAFLASGEGGIWEDYCFTSNVGRSHFPHRLAVVGASSREVSEQLAVISEGRDAPGVHRGVVASPARAKVAFLFTGRAQFARWAAGC
jgi:acyl transferase domain-containing protein